MMKQQLYTGDQLLDMSLFYFRGKGISPEELFIPRASHQKNHPKAQNTYVGWFERGYLNK